MSNKKGPDHVVVDGSNLATEGRSMPSLAQLSDAVSGFMDEHPDTAITVVVDATFGHRIDKKEVKEFEAGISNNELVAPPAGAVGRGDAFVLGIADKARASVLSNDSFQEFHGEYTWLFDEGRLIGGKPVPHVGWVWVDRVPVRGPISRKATKGSGAGSPRRSSGGRSRRGSKSDDSGRDSEARTGSREASGPMPTPKSPPPGRSSSASDRGSDRGSESRKADASRSDGSRSDGSKSAPKGGEPVNDLMPFLDFVENHPVGTSVNGTVDAYSSHGAYIAIADTDVRGYIPLRLMADPAPRSAKRTMKIDESVTAVVVSFSPGRRSIDCALPDMADAAIAAAREADVDDDSLDEETTKEMIAQETSASTKSSGRKTAAKKTAGRKTAAKKSVAKKAASKKSPSRKSAAKEAAPTTKKKAAAKKTAVKKTATKKKTSVRKAAAKTAAKKTAAKKSTAKKAAAVKKSPTRKSAAKKTAARKSAAKKSPTRKSAGAARAAETETSDDD